MIYSKQVVKELCVAGGHLRQKEPPLGSTKQYWKKEKREKKNHIHVCFFKWSQQEIALRY